MASRSVAEIGGSTFLNQSNIGPLKYLRRTSATNRGTAMAIKASQSRNTTTPEVSAAVMKTR